MKKIAAAMMAIMLSVAVMTPTYACTPPLESPGATTSPDVNITLSDDILSIINTAAEKAAEDVGIDIKPAEEKESLILNWVHGLKRFLTKEWMR